MFPLIIIIIIIIIICSNSNTNTVQRYKYSTAIQIHLKSGIYTFKTENEIEAEHMWIVAHKTTRVSRKNERIKRGS